jgi:hypothetical protein
MRQEDAQRESSSLPSELPVLAAPRGPRRQRMSSPVPHLNRRHALGLPAGSVRAAHVLGIVGIVCAMLLIPARHDLAIPPYLIYLLFLMLGHYFTAHGVTIATRIDPQPSPLHLPGGTVRAIVILALAGTIGWKYYSDPVELLQRYEASVSLLKEQPYIPVFVLGGFLVGVIVRGVLGRTPPELWQELEAWVSVMALIGIFADAIIRIVVIPSLSESIHMPYWESALGMTVAFYFGERT